MVFIKAYKGAFYLQEDKTADHRAARCLVLHYLQPRHFLRPAADTVFFSGVGFGATLAIPSAIQADVIDSDELVAGDRREGLYISL